MVVSTLDIKRDILSNLRWIWREHDSVGFKRATICAQLPLHRCNAVAKERKRDHQQKNTTIPVSYTHLTLPTTPYV